MKSCLNTICTIFIVIIACFFLIAMCDSSENGDSNSSTIENYNDNSQHHQILAKNYFKDYLKKNMKDAKSYEEISYTSVYNNNRNCYVVDLKYRAKNSFGAYVVERYMGDVTFEGTTVSISNVSKLE